jgi:hypothetical protein
MPENRKTKQPIWKKWWVWVIAVIVLIAIANIPIYSNKNVNVPTKQTSSETQQEQPARETFTNYNFSEVLSNANKFKGSDVDITGRVFGIPEKESSGELFLPIYTTPNKNQGATAISTISNIDIKKGDYIRVKGVIIKEIKGYVTLQKGTNGGIDTNSDELVMPYISATEIDKISSTDMLGSIVKRPLTEILVTDYNPEPINIKKVLVGRWLTEQKMIQQKGMPWQDSNWLVAELDKWIKDRPNWLDDEYISKVLVDVLDNWKTENIETNITKLKFSFSMEYVRNLLGDPSDSQHSEMQGLPDTDYLYYDVNDQRWQLVFENDKLKSKNQD